MVSVDQEFMSGVSGWLWLGVSLKVTVGKMSVEAASERLNGPAVPTSEVNHHMAAD